MVSRNAGIAFTLFITIFANFAHAADETNRELARTYGAFHLGRREFSQGARFLTDHLNADGTDAGAWNLLGLTYLRWGHLKHASDSFSRASRAAPSENRSTYLYNLADALARQGDLSGAWPALLEAKRADPRITADVDYALKNMKPGQPLPERVIEAGTGTAWRLLATAGAGYDTNVLLISDDNLAAAVSTGASSPYLSPAMQLQGVTPLNNSTIQTSAYSSFAYQTRKEAQTFNGLYSGASAEWGDAEDTVARYSNSLGVQGDLAYVNSNGFRFYNTGGALSWRLISRHSSRHETAFELPLRYTRYREEIGDSALDNRTGFSFRPALTYARRFGADRGSVGASFDKGLAKGTNYRSNTYVGTLTWTSALRWALTFRSSLEVTWLSYYDSTTSRLDKSGRATLSFSKPLRKGLVAAIDYAFRRNISNVSTAMYSKHTAGVLVTYEIF